jgi:deazaflavin-dependent oxidoreductase (nitroreductase family)
MSTRTKAEQRPPESARRPHRPQGLLRLAFRLPILLYRCHLGWLLGHRFLLLTHRGRKTGTVRSTMLEVLHYEPTSQESIVFSALGTRADWYRNIEAHPAIAVWTGRQRYVPTHRVLTDAETASVAGQWQQEHPWAARLVMPVLQRFGWSTGNAALTGGFPPDAVMVAFRPLASR